MFGLLSFLFPQPDSRELAEAIRNKAFLVDVRTPEEFLLGSVEGAVNIPLNELEGRIHEFKDKKTIVVFCRSGNRSGQAKSILNRYGFRNVLNGGTWQQVASVKKSL